MKVTICTGPNYAVPPIDGGGMSRAWWILAKRFAQMGQQVTIMSRARTGLPSREDIDGCTIIRLAGFDQRPRLVENIFFDFFYAQKIAPRLPEADVTVLNDFWLPIVAPVLNKRLGCCLVSVNRLPRSQYRFYDRCGGFVCPSSTVAEKLVQVAPQLADRVSIIPNPYDEAVFRPDSSKRSGLLYVGRVHPEKGVHYLIEAFKMLSCRWPDLKLTIVGPDEPDRGGGGLEYGQHLRTMARGLPVNFSGAIYDERALAEAYQSHTCFCYPSLAEHGETFGIAALEAMASGCVPVVSALPVFSAFVKSGRNGIVVDCQAGNPSSALAKSLDALLSRPEEAESMRRNGVNDARLFGSDTVAQQFVKLFECSIKEDEAQRYHSRHPHV